MSRGGEKMGNPSEAVEEVQPIPEQSPEQAESNEAPDPVAILEEVDAEVDLHDVESLDRREIKGFLRELESVRDRAEELSTAQQINYFTMLGALRFLSVKVDIFRNEELFTREDLDEMGRYSGATDVEKRIRSEARAGLQDSPLRNVPSDRIALRKKLKKFERRLKKEDLGKIMQRMEQVVEDLNAAKNLANGLQGADKETIDAVINLNKELKQRLFEAKEFFKAIASMTEAAEQARQDAADRVKAHVEATVLEKGKDFKEKVSLDGEVLTFSYRDRQDLTLITKTIRLVYDPVTQTVEALSYGGYGQDRNFTYAPYYAPKRGKAREYHPYSEEAIQELLNPEQE
jgi:hypothetical protein